MTKLEIRTAIDAAIESGKLKAAPTTIRAGNERLNITLDGWLIHERPTEAVAAVLLAATEYFVVADTFSGKSLVQ